MGDFFISPQELWAVTARHERLRIFDVRRRPAIEAASRFIPGSRWRDHMRVADWAATQERDKPMVLACMHGHNVSQMTGATLRDNGFCARVLAGGVEGWLKQDLPSVGQCELLPFDADQPSQWVTRLGAGIDRIACSWLIRRFIDPAARIHFVETDWVLDVAEEMNAIAFNTPGAGIEHDGAECSFDALVEMFQMNDPVVKQLAVIIRGAETNRHELAPEAAGLIAVSLGNAAIARNDQHALQLGMPVYDALYTRLRLTAGETDDRQPMVS